MINQKAGYALNDRRDQISKKFAEVVYNTQKEYFVRFDLSERKLNELAYIDISKLFIALISSRPKLFTEYVEWQINVLSKRGIPKELLKSNLYALNSVIYEMINDETNEVITEYIHEGIKVFDEKEKLPPKYINENDEYGKEAKQQDAVQHILSLAKSKPEIKKIYEKILLPVQYEVGRLWQMNSINVAEEHYATSTTIMLLEKIKAKAKEEAFVGRKLLASCVGEELHDTGIRFVRDFFELSGWDTYYTGSNTPTESMLLSIKKYKPDLIAISLTMSTYLSSVKNLIKAIKGSEFKNIPIIVGGYTFNKYEELWKEVGADAYATDADSGLRKADSLLSA